MRAKKGKLSKKTRLKGTVPTYFILPHPPPQAQTKCLLKKLDIELFEYVHQCYHCALFVSWFFVSISFEVVSQRLWICEFQI